MIPESVLRLLGSETSCVADDVSVADSRRVVGLGALVLAGLAGGPCGLGAQQAASCRPVAIDPGRALPTVLRPLPDSFAMAVGRALRDTRCPGAGPQVERVRGLLAPLVRVGGERLRGVRLVVAESPEVNMSASTVGTWGHLVIAHTGFLAYADSMAQAAEDAPQAEARDRADTYLSAVLGHELAHVLLGHTDGSPCSLRGGVGDAPSGAPGDPSGRKLPAGFVDCRRVSQQQELAADSVGAVLLLQARTGLALRHFGDLVRFWEREGEAARGQEIDVAANRVTSTHPSGIRRAAALMRQWATLLEVQDRFDAAVALVAANVELDRAGALLDSVSLVAPSIPVVEETRAALHMAEWLASATTNGLKFAPSVAVSQARFVDVAKGGAIPGDARLLARARRALEALPQLDQRGASLSNLAVLDVLQGNTATAMARARRARVLLPDQLGVLNNLVFVLRLAGQADSALAVASDLIGLPVPGTRGVDRGVLESWTERCLGNGGVPDVIALCFNWLRLAHERAPQVVRPGLQAFARSYAGWPWAEEARRLAALAPERSGNAVASPGAGGGPSTGDWVLRDTQRDQAHALGDRLAGVLEDLPPERIQVERAADGAVLRIDGHGLLLRSGPGTPATAALRGAIVTAGTRWALAGVQIGEPLQEVRERLGVPMEDDGDSAVWRRASLVFAVTYRGGRVAAMALVLQPGQ